MWIGMPAARRLQLQGESDMCAGRNKSGTKGGPGMSKRIRARSAVIVCFTLVLATAVLTAPLYGSGGSSSSRNHVKVDLVNANGADVGFVKLTKQGGKVIVRGEVQGFTPGLHGFHVHSVGQCVAPFTSAGGRYNPGGGGHGAHAGAMPSLLVLDEGNGNAGVGTDNYAIAE